MSETRQDEHLLDRVTYPKDLAGLSIDELQKLSDEIRAEIIETVSQNGGHLSSNLGTVELTVALHRVFCAENDRILWDVGHQSYTHKILTGRKDRFHLLRKQNGLSGFCNPQESPFDAFISGHAGNALSAAMGIQVTKEQKNELGNVIAVIGDGCLINGITMEALNNVCDACKKMIIVINDNRMSIDKSTGAISHYLNSLITGKNYNRFKALVKMMLGRIPGGKPIVSGVQQLESSAKNLFVPGLFFEELGIRYIGPINGHDIPMMLRTFEHVRDFTRPVLVHVITEKGHGCPYASEKPTQFHSIGAFNPTTGTEQTAKNALQQKPEGYSETFGKIISDIVERDDRVNIVCAATATGCGITPDFMEKHPDRFFDVGIAEEHSAIFAAGMATQGKRPIVAMYATFFPRVLDCVYHDICLQNLPVTFCLDRAGTVSDGPTHHGLYDTSFLLAMPNLSILAPESPASLRSLLDLTLKQNSPVVIRYPRRYRGNETECKSEVSWGKAEIMQSGTDAAIFALGDELFTAMQVAKELKETHNISVCVVCVRFLRPFDRDLLLDIAQKMPVFTLENNTVHGGLFTVASETLVNAKHRGLHPFAYDTHKIIPNGTINEIREHEGLCEEQIARQIVQTLKENKI